jgi:hypothetical protein
MIVTQTAIEPQTAGLAMYVIRHVLLTTTLINKVFAEPLTLTGIYLAKQSQTSCLTLQIRYDYARNVEIRESLTSSSQGALLPLAWGGVGGSILELTRTLSIAIFLSLRRAIQMIRSLISQ